MKKAQLIGFGVAGIAAILAGIMLKSVLNTKPKETKVVETLVNATEVLVARADIGLGQVVTDGHFKWQKWPQDALSSGYITKAGGANAMRDMSGRIARAPIMAGEPITNNKLIKPGDGGVLAAILPAGMRAISTKIKEDTSAGRLVLPNDHVDVILIRRVRSRSGQDEHVSDTLFRNVRVLAIGQQLETKEGKKAADSANTATLELTPKQAELLALANAMGDISLSLRSVADLSTDGNGPLSGNDLNKQRGNAIRVMRYGVRSRAYGMN